MKFKKGDKFCTEGSSGEMNYGEIVNVHNRLGSGLPTHYQVMWYNFPSQTFFLEADIVDPIWEHARQTWAKEVEQKINEIKGGFIVDPGGLERVLRAATFDDTNLRLHKSLLGKCEHDFKRYDSGWTSYEYCTKCDAKREPQ